MSDIPFGLGYKIRDAQEEERKGQTEETKSILSSLARLGNDSVNETFKCFITSDQINSARDFEGGN